MLRDSSSHIASLHHKLLTVRLSGKVSLSLLAKQGELQAALQSFERALELARLLEDQESQTLIKKALEELNSRIVDEMKSDGGAPSD